MRYSTWIILFIVILLLLLTTQGIVQAKLYQLKVSVSQDRLMNFEISSEALRSRFREIFKNPDDYKSEIKRNVVESGILNNVDPSDLEANIVVRFGVAFSNSVRLMSLKPILRLSQDRKIILLVKYAFFMERNRKMDIAAKKYQEALALIQKGEKSNMMGFALLHSGYSYAVIGERKKAIVLLQKTVDDMPGTHFAQTAVILLNILLENEKTESHILTQKTSTIDKARALFKSGIYDKSCNFYDQSAGLTVDDIYKKGRCREEIGKRKEAIQIYSELANKSGQVALQANRRLLILSKFYSAGKDIEKQAEKNAKRLLDKNVVNEINSAAKEQKKSLVVREIISNLKDIQVKQDNKQDIDDQEKILIKEIGTELTSNINIDQKDKMDLDYELKKREDEDARIAAEKERELLEKKKQEKLSLEEIKRKKELEEQIEKFRLEKEERLKKEAQLKKEEDARRLVEEERLKREENKRKKLEEERAAREEVERKKIEAQRLERERKLALISEQAEKKRKKLEAEKLERERKLALASEQVSKGREKLEAERLAKDEAKRKKLEAEKLERERKLALASEQVSKGREKLEAERLARDEAKRKKLEAEKLEKERKLALASEQVEKKRERLEAERLAKEEAKRKKLEAEKKNNEPLEKTQDIKEENKEDILKNVYMSFTLFDGRILKAKNVKLDDMNFLLSGPLMSAVVPLVNLKFMKLLNSKSSKIYISLELKNHEKIKFNTASFDKKNQILIKGKAYSLKDVREMSIEKE